MKDKIIKSVIIVLACMVIYMVIYNHTNQINSKNRNNTYESTNNHLNNRIDFVNKYIETLMNNNFQEGFNMLDNSSRDKFNNKLTQYSEYIMNETRNMNKTKDGLMVNLVEDLYMKKYNIIEYEIISKDFEYIQNNEVYFSPEYKLFHEFKLIEYSPNVFEIYIR